MVRNARQIAKRQGVVNPENTFASVKRFIGRKMNEVAEESKQVPYKVRCAATRLGDRCLEAASAGRNSQVCRLCWLQPGLLPLMTCSLQRWSLATLLRRSDCAHSRQLTVVGVVCIFGKGAALVECLYHCC